MRCPSTRRLKLNDRIQVHKAKTSFSTLFTWTKLSIRLPENILDMSPRKHSRPDSQDKLSTWLPGRTLNTTPWKNSGHDSLKEHYPLFHACVCQMCTRCLVFAFTLKHPGIYTPWYWHTMTLTHLHTETPDIDTPSRWPTFTLTHL